MEKQLSTFRYTVWTIFFANLVIAINLPLAYAMLTVYDIYPPHRFFGIIISSALALLTVIIYALIIKREETQFPLPTTQVVTLGLYAGLLCALTNHIGCFVVSLMNQHDSVSGMSIRFIILAVGLVCGLCAGVLVGFIFALGPTGAALNPQQKPRTPLNLSKINYVSLSLYYHSIIDTLCGSIVWHPSFRHSVLSFGTSFSLSHSSRS